MRRVLPLVAAFLLLGCSQPAATPAPSLTVKLPTHGCAPVAGYYHHPGPTAHPDCYDPWEVPLADCIMPAPGDPVPACLRP